MTQTPLRALLMAVTLTGTVMVVATTATPAAAVAGAQPVVYVSPNPSGPGDQVTLVARNFCADPACSHVTVTVAGRQVVTAVSVAADGGFSVDFRLSEPPGDYPLTASQHTPAGDWSAQTLVRIAASDPAPSAAAGGGAGTGSSRARATAADGTPGGSGDTTAGSTRAAAEGGHGRRAGWIWSVVAVGLVLMASGAGAALWRARRSGATGG